MKRRTILIVIATPVLAILLCCVFFGKKQTSPIGQTEGKAGAAEAPVSIVGPVEDANVKVDGANGSTINATMGIKEDSIQEDEEPSSTAAPTATPAPTATAAPSATPEPTQESGSTGLTWEEFNALSPEARDAYKDSFPDFEAFYNWMAAAQERFKNDHPDIEIGPGESVDLSQLS